MNSIALYAVAQTVAVSIASCRHLPTIFLRREHFSLLSDGVIVGKTAVGRGTVLVLNMDELGAVQLRFLLMQNGTIDLGMTR